MAVIDKQFHVPQEGHAVYIAAAWPTVGENLLWAITDYGQVKKLDVIQQIFMKVPTLSIRSAEEETGKPLQREDWQDIGALIQGNVLSKEEAIKHSCSRTKDGIWSALFADRKGQAPNRWKVSYLLIQWNPQYKQRMFAAGIHIYVDDQLCATLREEDDGDAIPCTEKGRPTALAGSKLSIKVQNSLLSICSIKVFGYSQLFKANPQPRKAEQLSASALDEVFFLDKAYRVYQDLGHGTWKAVT